MSVSLNYFYSITPSDFFIPALVDGFLLESELELVSWTLLSILTYRNNAGVLMDSAHDPISNSTSPLTNPLGTLPSAPLKNYHQNHFHVS